MNKSQIKVSELKARGAALIIGSLLWQDHLRDQNDGIRKKWRNHYLNIENKISVKCPIRYGRKSSGGVYTMVFSTLCSEENLGCAYIIPFKNNVNHTAKNLIELSKELSFAEGMGGEFVAGIRSPWAVLGILFNPKIPDDLHAELLSVWKKKYRQEKGFDSTLFKLGSETSAVLKNGLLNFAWPSGLDVADQVALDSLDFVLATVTKPTDYPHISDLLINVNSDLTRKYFLNNVSNKIRTFQDPYILEKINKNILKEMDIEITDNFIEP